MKYVYLFILGMSVFTIQASKMDYCDSIDNPKTVSFVKILKNIGKFSVFLDCLAKSERYELLNPLFRATGSKGTSFYTVIVPIDDAFNHVGSLDFLNDARDAAQQKKNYTLFIDSLIVEHEASAQSLFDGVVPDTKAGVKLSFDFFNAYMCTIPVFGMGMMHIVSSVPVCDSIKKLMGPERVQSYEAFAIEKKAHNSYEALLLLGIGTTTLHYFDKAELNDVLKNEHNNPLTTIVASNNAYQDAGIDGLVDNNNATIALERLQSLVNYWIIDESVGLEALFDNNLYVTRAGTKIKIDALRYGRYELYVGLTRCIVVDTVFINPTLKDWKKVI